METTSNRLAYYERMKENARQQKANHAFGFWSGAIATEKAAQHRMHLTAFGAGLVWGLVVGIVVSGLVVQFIGGR